ncbi:MAG: hypothetical protein D3M94_06350 [Rhodocyclales bacterium GT-UBC]|nr:MAG: hypothetical protein D3M94_06350 [Rhodocyclales bacterium GT-UBC]
MHLFVDISSHGFGHLAITAPVLNALAGRLPGLRLSIRSALPPAQLHQRIGVPFELIAGCSDFGYRMIDATRIDRAASAAAYRQAHADWPGSIAAEAAFLERLQPDLVLTNVSYLPLAAASALGIPCLSLCSLNWAELFEHFFGAEPWAATIHQEILAAYRSASAFLRITPGMPMTALDNLQAIGPISQHGQHHDLGLGGDKAVLVVMGGIDHPLPVDNWPAVPGIRWIVDGRFPFRHPSAMPHTAFALTFTDLLASVDAVITKPGYGMFTEAAANGIPVLYQRREDWPEQDCLIAWLNAHARCLEIGCKQLQKGHLAAALTSLWHQTAPARPDLTGIDEAVVKIANLIDTRSGS